MKFYSKLVLQPQTANDLYLAEKFFVSNYKIALSKNDMGGAIYNLYYKASIEYKLGAYDNSEETIVEALKLLEVNDNSAYAIATKKSFYNLLGIIYEEQRNKEKALELYQKTLEMASNTLDSATIYNNISIVHKNYKDNIRAKNELLKAYAIIPRLKDTLTQALILDNLGVLNNELNGTGLSLMMKSLELRELTKDTSKIFISYSHLAEYFNNIGDTSRSKSYALKALDFANKLNSPSYKNYALGLLTDLSGDLFAKSYKKLNDSLHKADQESRNKFAMIRYDVTKKEKELLYSQRVKERVIIGAIFIVIVFIFLIVYQRFLHNKDKLQEVYETESRISKRIHDEVANDVYQFMTKLDAENTYNEHLINDLHNIYSKTRDISKEHRLLEEDILFSDVIKDLVLSYSDENTSVIDKGSTEVNWDALSKVKKNTIYKVLQELLINMKKHSQATVAVLMFKSKGKKTIITYTDNGIGCQIKKHTGLQNVETRINSIQGTITFDSELNKGFKVKIVV